jgi:hypothetical protein
MYCIHCDEVTHECLLADASSENFDPSKTPDGCSPDGFCKDATGDYCSEYLNEYGDIQE